MGDVVASVIIGNYNYARFLADAIDSALGQTHPATEVVVVDDGSIDDSRDVIARYVARHGDRVTAVLKENAGMASTYNAGFPRSRGELVVFLDADDMLLPTAVESALAAWTGRPDASKVHWPLWEVDGRGARTGGVVPQLPLRAGDFRDAVLAGGPDAYLSPPTSGNAWSRAFLDTALPMPEPDFRQHADVYLATLAAVFGPVGLVAEPQGLYRVHGGNDYAGRPVEERNRRNLAIYEHRCRELARYAARAGTLVDAAAWKRPGSPYAWMARLQAALDELREAVPEGSTVVLADDEHWGEKRGGAGILAGRRTLPFLERDGVYFGPPPDDASAIRELERMRAEGAGHFVLAWPAFWWLDHYAAFHAHLRRSYALALENERLLVFDLRRAPGARPLVRTAPRVIEKGK
jgi:glycosyltransferase involved in cell wall biosynthesis